MDQNQATETGRYGMLEPPPSDKNEIIGKNIVDPRKQEIGQVVSMTEDSMLAYGPPDPRKQALSSLNIPRKHIQGVDKNGAIQIRAPRDVAYREFANQPVKV